MGVENWKASNWGSGWFEILKLGSETKEDLVREAVSIPNLPLINYFAFLLSLCSRSFPFSFLWFLPSKNPQNHTDFGVDWCRSSTSGAFIKTLEPCFVCQSLWFSLRSTWIPLPGLVFLNDIYLLRIVCHISWLPITVLGVCLRVYSTNLIQWKGKKWQRGLRLSEV